MASEAADLLRKMGVTKVEVVGELGPRDVVVATVDPKSFSEKRRHVVVTELNRVFPDNRIIVTAADVRLSVVRRPVT